MHCPKQKSCKPPTYTSRKSPISLFTRTRSFKSCKTPTYPYNKATRRRSHKAALAYPVSTSRSSSYSTDSLMFNISIAMATTSTSSCTRSIQGGMLESIEYSYSYRYVLNHIRELLAYTVRSLLIVRSRVRYALEQNSPIIYSRTFILRRHAIRIPAQRHRRRRLTASVTAGRTGSPRRAPHADRASTALGVCALPMFPS